MHLKPERTPTEAIVPNRLTPVAEMAFLALMGIVKAAHLLHDPSPHSDAIIRAWPGVFKWSVFFFSVDIQRPGVEQDAKFFMQDLIAATWFTFTRVDRIAAIMAETSGAIELMMELFFLEGSIPQMSIVNHPNAAATLDSMLHEAEDVWGTLDRVVATANGDAERIARVALSRLRTAANGPGFETPIGGAALNLMCRLCRRRGHPLLYAFLHHNAIATVTKVAASAARAYMKTGNDGVIPALVGSFGFVANCLESTDGFTWVTIAMQSGLIQAFLEVSILLPTLPVECDGDMILAIFKVILPKYLIYRSVVQAADGAMRKVESNPASKWVSQTPAKDVWHNFKRVAFERRALVANLTDTKHKAITSCDNSKMDTMNTEHFNDDDEQQRNPAWDTPFYAYSTPVHHHPFPTQYPPPPWATPMLSDTVQPRYNSFPPQTTHTVNTEERKTYRDQGAQAESSARHWDDKLSVILDAMKSVNWKLGDLLYYLFRVKTETGAEVKRSRSHAQVVSKFLGGKARYYPSIILAEWLKSADGLPKLGDIERDLMYSMEVDYQQIRAARPGLTSFAAQLVGRKLEMEIKKVVMKKNGLQTFTTGGGDIAKAGQGVDTYTDAQAIFRLHQPLTWAYLLRLATPYSHQAPAQGTVVAQKVVTHMMGELAYSRNMYAKMIPQEKGLLLFACRANRYLVSYDSRVGSATSYHATYEALRALAKFDLGLVEELGRSPDSSLIIRLDNVQSYVRPRNLRLGREASMNIGTAATAFVMKNFSPAAVDLQKKLDILALKSRKNLTVRKIRDLIDYKNLHQVLILQWLRTLVTFVPQLHRYKHAVSILYATEAKKIRLPLEQTQVFPLSTNGRNETLVKQRNLTING
ncbi:hypothetical protein CCMSSC00406_0006636 [Pleurotus cornucopiae]|uniref:Uncharacterized protein n=1 Tax=Pleurotus cornucopiae TaxID=5321 RepID=A0ACB7ITH6_PLECO|nr:hypothetical protein CCMSSC00406_0006636 [Pleurotus cornucopiae]